ncbi:MAG: phasin family protein [Nitrospira sp.]|nr:phasin family protein [Nitrospira sp.]
MSINEILHKALMAGIGLPEKLKELVDDLIEKGELSKSEGARLLKECSEKVSKSGDELNKGMAELINKTLEKMNIPTSADMDKLTKKITALSSRLKKLEDSHKK